jgi:hypothetical protein
VAVALIDAALPSENVFVAASDEEDEAAPLLSSIPAVVEVGAGAPLLILLSIRCVRATRSP